MKLKNCKTNNRKRLNIIKIIYNTLNQILSHYIFGVTNPFLHSKNAHCIAKEYTEFNQENDNYIKFKGE